MGFAHFDGHLRPTVFRQQLFQVASGIQYKCALTDARALKLQGNNPYFSQKSLSSMAVAPSSDVPVTDALILLSRSVTSTSA